MTLCPFCGAVGGQTKAGLSGARQRYRCDACNRRYIPEPASRGYPEELRVEAIALYAQGVGIRAIARKIEVNPQTVVNWLRQSGEQIRVRSAVAPLPEPKALSPEAFPDARRSTIDDVARHAGVSTSTVSNYLNEKGHMKEATRLRVREAIEALRFTPSALVRALRKGETRILGVLLFGIYDLDESPETSISHPLLSGINRAADAAHYDILLYTGYPHRRSMHPGLDFLNGHVDGLLWVAPGLDDPILKSAVDAGLPVMTALTRHVPKGSGWVNSENLGAVVDIVAHLNDRGHRRIAYLGTIDTSNALDRRDGYRQGLAAVGLPHDPLLEIGIDGKIIPPIAYAEAIDRLLSLASPPTAIITMSDAAASECANILERHGLRVPQDMALVGFDDVVAAKEIAGGLTTVHQQFRLIGRKAIEGLVAMIAGDSAENWQITLPALLVPRKSTSQQLS